MIPPAGIHSCCELIVRVYQNRPEIDGRRADVGALDPLPPFDALSLTSMASAYELAATTPAAASAIPFRRLRLRARWRASSISACSSS
jgi:hypothetical protein